MKLMEKGQGWLFWTVVLISLVSLFLAWGSARADTIIAEQTDRSSQISNYVTMGNTWGSRVLNHSTFVATLSGSSTTMVIYAGLFNPTTNPIADIQFNCLDSGCTDFGGTDTADAAAPDGSTYTPNFQDESGGLINFNLSGMTWLNRSAAAMDYPHFVSGHTYQVTIAAYSSSGYRNFANVWGSSSGAACAQYSCTEFQTGGGYSSASPYFVLSASSPPGPAYTVPTLTYMHPIDQSTASSTSVALDAGYFVPDATDTRALIDEVAISVYDITNGYAPAFYATSSVAYGDVSTFSTSTTLISGHTYSMQTSLTNASNTYTVFSGGNTTYADNTGHSTFSVISNGLQSQIGVGSTTQIYTGLATSTCDLLNITGCFQNAMVWAFWPSDSMLQSIAKDGSLIAMYHPVGDVTQTISALSNLGATSTAAFTLVEDAPIMTNILTPLVNGIAIIMWLPFGVWFLKRIRHIEI